MQVVRTSRPAVLATALLAGLSAPLVHGATPGEADAYSTSDAHASYLPQGATVQVQSNFSNDGPWEAGPVSTSIESRSSSSTDLVGSPLTTTESDALSYAGQGRAGVLASVAVNTAGGNLNSGFGNAEAVASWWDGVVIDKTGLTGQSGYLTANLLLDGTLFVQATEQTANNVGRSFATLSIVGEGLAPAVGQATGGQCLSGAGYCAYAFAGTPNSTGGPANGYYEFGALSVTIPFTFGTEFYLGYTLKAEAFAQAISWNEFAAADSATGLADFAHTLAWGGIDGVFRSGGTPVGGFTLTSGSGIDYTQSTAAVPLPATQLMLATGISALVVYRRRRRCSADRKIS